MKYSLIAVAFLIATLIPVPSHTTHKDGLFMTGPDTKAGSVDAKAPAVKHKFAKIVFATEVSEESVNQAIDFMEKSKADVEFVVIELNTPGGSVPDGFRLGKVIEEYGKPVHCIVDGEAHSMGFYLLQPCSTRTMTKRATLMAHEPSLGGRMYGNQHYFQDVANILATLSSAMAEHEAARLCITSDAFKKGIDNQAWWMDWHEAARIGATDYIATSVPAYLESLGATGTLPKDLLSPLNSLEFCP